MDKFMSKLKHWPFQRQSLLHDHDSEATDQPSKPIGYAEASPTKRRKKNKHVGGKVVDLEQTHGLRSDLCSPGTKSGSTRATCYEQKREKQKSMGNKRCQPQAPTKEHFKTTLRGEELEETYRMFTESRKKTADDGIYASQLDRKRDKIYIFATSKEDGEAYVKNNKLLQECDVEVFKSKKPKPCYCTNCNNRTCDSLKGALDTSTKEWIGLGSPILAIPKEIYDRYIKDESGLNSLRKIQGYLISLFRKPSFYSLNYKMIEGKFFTMACHMIQVDAQPIPEANESSEGEAARPGKDVVVTCYHPISGCKYGEELVMLTEKTENLSTKVVCLSEDYVHEARGGKGLHDCSGYDILVFDVNRSVKELLKTKAKNFCIPLNPEKDIQLKLFKGAPDIGQEVMKRGASSGVTYGKVIQRDFDIFRSGGAPIPGFVVATSTNESKFCIGGDSGSLVLQPYKNIFGNNQNHHQPSTSNVSQASAQRSLYAYGVIWGTVDVMDTTGDEPRYVEDATYCARLDINLNGLGGQFIFPDF